MYITTCHNTIYIQIKLNLENDAVIYLCPGSDPTCETQDHLHFATPMVSTDRNVSKSLIRVNFFKSRYNSSSSSRLPSIDEW